MDFNTPAQQATYEKVNVLLKELFGETGVFPSDERPSFLIPKGSAMTQIVIYPWRDDSATICIRAYVVFGAEITPELMRFLLTENNDMRFGAFGLDSDGDIFFEYAIVGPSCDKEELKASVLAVAFVADDYDDKIVSRWGGQRAADRMTSQG